MLQIINETNRIQARVRPMEFGFQGTYSRPARIGRIDTRTMILGSRGGAQTRVQLTSTHARFTTSSISDDPRMALWKGKLICLIVFDEFSLVEECVEGSDYCP